jgi:hypothetical protein
MPDPRFYESDTYVVLEPGQSEQFLTAAELLEKLATIVAKHPEDLPRDVQQYKTVKEQAQQLMASSCEFSTGPGQFLQWYAVRLEK